MNIKHFPYRIVNLCLFLLLLLSASQPVHAGPSIDSPAAAVTGTTPRAETLYFNGLQWGPVYGWNPYSTSNNNSLAISQDGNTILTVWETPYMYNMLDGKQYPLLAAGPWAWNAGRTEITFKIKSAARWSDGTPVTAQDVAYTWTTHFLYWTPIRYIYQDYISDVLAVDPQTVKIKAQLDGTGKPINPLMVQSYLSEVYVVQKAWTQALEARSNYDNAALMSDRAEDFVASGPYRKYYVDNTKVVLVRNDNYWGKAASMWGKLPVPKYLAHVIYPDNDAGLAAFKAGQVDVSQQFIANEQKLWLEDHLPVSTYLPDAPYQVGASLPTAFFNLQAYGMDQVSIRKAIALAVDYESIILNAMTKQSATFEQVPRSLMNPSAGEQALYDHTAVADLQWTGNDIAEAQALLDSAGITDTDGDGWREYNGQKLTYIATCPNGWSDWQAAIELVAAAGRAIGIDITTNYPEWSEYQTIVTASDQPLPAGYDIFMMWSDGAGPTQPWSRIRHLMSSEFVGMANNWNGNWGGYVNPAADAVIQAIPQETDPAVLKAYYTELTRIYLTDIPSFTLMYRPQQFHTVNETVWSNFPHQGDGTNPPVPPLDLIFGYSIAGLYKLEGSPMVLSSSRLDANPSAASTVRLKITFSEAVTGVDKTDFNPAITGGLKGVAVASVSGSGATYTVTVNTGSGNGTIRLDVVDDNTITDATHHPLGGPGTKDGIFTNGQTYSIKKAATFADVPTSHLYWRYIEILYANGLTGGCATAPLKFCPDQIMNRGQAAVFMMRGNFGPSYVPPVPTHIFLDDWSKGPWAEGWAEGMRKKGLSAGCSANPLKYCPWDLIPREQAVIFALRMKYGTSYTPPPAKGNVFADMTDTSYYATSWAEQAYKDGIIPSCGMSGGKPKICPKDLVSRGLGAYMIVRAKNLTMP